MNETCKNQMSAAQLQDLQWRLYWIAGREYYRNQIQNNQSSAASEQMKTWDNLAAKAYPDHKFSDGNAELNEYLEYFNFKLWFPGWNDANCSFDQKEFACFSAWLADMPQAGRISTLQKIADSATPVDFFCDTFTENDPIYTTRFPSDEPLGGKPAAKWPWLVGFAAVGVLGAVVVAKANG